MSPNTKRALPLLFLLALALALALGLFHHNTPSGEKSKLIGYAPAPFDIPVVGNSEMRFTPERWQGKIVVLNVFATWCESCVEEHPALMNLAKKGVVDILGINWKEKPEKAVEWLNQHGNPYQLIGSDTEGRTTLALGLSGVPETFIIDQNGLIAYNTKAPITDEEIETMILPLVARLLANAPH